MASDAGMYDHLFKILIIGDSGVGKSCLMLRFTDDTFNERQLATIGVDFKVKYLKENGKRLKLAVWDTAGQERFRTLTASYYRGAQGIILVYDCTQPQTFDNIKPWLQEVATHSTHEAAVKLLVANKVDLEGQRQVTTQQGEEFALEHGMIYIETSAKTKLKVQEAFGELVLKIMETPELLEGTAPLKMGAQGQGGTKQLGARGQQPQDQNQCGC